MKKFLTLLITLIVLAIGTVYSTMNSFKTVNSESTDIITFKVTEGEPLSKIATDLEESDLVQDKYKFELYTKLYKKYPTFKAGIFRIAKNLSIEEVVGQLSKPVNMEITIKISEGFRYDEVVDQVTNQIVAQTCELNSKDCFSEIARKFDKDEFTSLIENPNSSTLPTLIQKSFPNGKTLEGFLYPDTYYFDANVTSSEVLQKILANFASRFDSLYSSSTNIQGLDLNFYDILKLTSVVTRESSHKVEDDKLIAGVLLNRLSQSYPLQCDTINHYHFKSWTYELTQTDLTKDYPYNSYTKVGLPPTPISNVSISTFQNVLNATETDYFYFLADRKGVLHYSKTWAEHVNFINEYLR